MVENVTEKNFGTIQKLAIFVGDHLVAPIKLSQWETQGRSGVIVRFIENGRVHWEIEPKDISNFLFPSYLKHDK